MRHSLGIIALVGLSLVGCSRGVKLAPEALEKPSTWPFVRRTIEADGALTAGTFGGHLNIIWEKRVPGKPSGPLTLQHGLLVYPSVKRRTRFFDALTGEYVGKFKTKAPSQSGLAVLDSLAVEAVQPPGNMLICNNLATGHRAWQAPVKEASAGSIIVQNRLLIGSAAGRLTAYDLSDGQIIWTFETEDRFSAPPSFGHNTVFQPGESGTLYAVAPDSGSERYRVKVDGPMVAAAAVGDLVIATDMHGRVYGIDPADGKIVWRTELSGPVWTAPALADGRAYVGHSGGEVVALDESDGRMLWRFETVEVVRASVIVAGDYVIVGTLGGKVYSLNAADGSVVDRRELKGAVATAPVTDGDRVYVATEDGYIICFGDENEQTRQVNK